MSPTPSYDLWGSDNIGNASRPKKRFFELDLSNKSEVINWLLGEMSYLQDQNRDRINKIHRNVAMYKGIQYQSQQMGSRQAYDNATFFGNPDQTDKLVVNDIYDLVIKSTAREIKYRPAIEILPANDEFGDKTGSRFCKYLSDYVWYKNKFEGDIQNQCVKLKRIMGEVFLAILWDEDFGDEYPESKEFRSQFMEGKTVRVENSDGEKVTIGGPIYQGDVKYEVWMTTDVLLDKKEKFEDCDFMFHQSVHHVSELKKMYPASASEITGGGNTNDLWDYEKCKQRELQNEAVLWKFYHRRTPFLPTGAEVHFINNKIVKLKEFPFSHKELPVKRLTDIDLPGELHGQSIIDFIKGLTGTYNNLTNIAARNLYIVGHPKWVFPLGSVKKEALGNAITLVEYKGPVAPVLAQQNPTPPELYSFRESIKQDYTNLAGVGMVSQGTPPPGIKAAVALQFLAEQESERDNEKILKYNEWIRQIPEMTLTVCSDKYKDDDKRIIKIIGKNNEWMTQFFPVKYLKQQYDIRIQNSSALPQSKSMRMQTLLDLTERFPNLVAPEQVLDMLDMAQSQKFTDIVSVSVRAAEAENEQLLEKGNSINDPEDYEDHLVHWPVHVKQVREWSFKNKTEPSRQDRMKDHIRATEYLMSEYAKKNPLFAEKISTLNGFPMFYVPEPTPLPPSPEEATSLDTVAAAVGMPAMNDQLPDQSGQDVQAGMPPSEAAQISQSGAAPVSNESGPDVAPPVEQIQITSAQ